MYMLRGPKIVKSLQMSSDAAPARVFTIRSNRASHFVPTGPGTFKEPLLITTGIESNRGTLICICPSC